MEINSQRYISDCRIILDQKESGVFIGLPTDTTVAFMENCKKANYVVRQFNLNTPANSDSWNMLSEIQKNPERATDLANILCNTLTDWTIQPAASLLESLMLYVAFNDDYKNTDQNMFGVYYALLAATEQGEIYNWYDLNEFYRQQPRCVEAYHAYQSYPEAMKQKAAGMLLSMLNGICINSMRPALSENDMDLSLPCKIPCAYFIIPSLLHPMRNVLESLFLFSLFSNILDGAERAKNKQCAVPVSVLTKFYDLQTFGRFSRQELDYMESRNIKLKVF